MTRKQNGEGTCEDCGAKGVPLFQIETAHSVMNYCAICNARNKASRSLGEHAVNALRGPQDGTAKKGMLNVQMNEDLDTTPFADKNDMLIYNSGVVFYGQIYAHLSDAEAKAQLTNDAQRVILAHRDAIRQAQVHKLREQAIRENIRRIESRQTESDRIEQKREDKKFESALADWDTLATEGKIGKRKVSPAAKKLEKLGLKAAILDGLFDDEKIAAYRAKKAEAAAKLAAEKAATETEKEKDGNKE